MPRCPISHLGTAGELRSLRAVEDGYIWRAVITRYDQQGRRVGGRCLPLASLGRMAAARETRPAGDRDRVRGDTGTEFEKPAATGRNGICRISSWLGRKPPTDSRHTRHLT